MRVSDIITEHLGGFSLEQIIRSVFFLVFLFYSLYEHWNDPGFGVLWGSSSTTSKQFCCR